MEIQSHRLRGVAQVECPNADERPEGEISLIVIHCISLPGGHFGNTNIERLFCNRLEPAEHRDFQSLAGVRVSSHVLIRRDGTVLQFVPFDKRAWHAGESVWQGRKRCNDFSVGIELEGTDESEFRDVQYRRLADICQALVAAYDIPADHIVGHSDIAPSRKKDPGPCFDWVGFRNSMESV